MSEGEGSLEYLRSARAIRERAERIFAAGGDGDLAHFELHLERLPEAADRVVAVTRRAYPDLEIPIHGRWNHFGSDRLARFEQRIATLDEEEQARTRFDLAVTSVLLDAGAGEAWHYLEPESQTLWTRSEGLAVASFHMFVSGFFGDGPMRATPNVLEAMTEARLAEGFQVRRDNPLVGLAGRVELLRALGRAIGPHRERVGSVFDPFLVKGRRLPATEILRTVLETFGSIWPGRLTLDGENLGDVWLHPRAGGEGRTAGLVPFHKLSQWLTYSLIEPFAAYGIDVSELDELTGLAEYRNGGLFIDCGVLTLQDPEAGRAWHPADAEVIVEWRALTVSLLDRLAVRVRDALGCDETELPLAKVLEGGSWRAGREIARERRADGSPPLRVKSDGTVF